MSHTKDIDERNQSSAGLEAADPRDLALVDLLYGELDGSARERAEQRVREDDGLAGELEALTRIRAMMRELPDEDPPEALSTKLLHAAAAEVASSRARPDDEEQPSLWARLRRLFMPLMMHPGLAAAASLILVGGVAGALYVSGELKMASVSHEAAPAALEQAQTTAAGAAQPGAAAAPALENAAVPAPAAVPEPVIDGLEAGGGGSRGLGQATEMDREQAFGQVPQQAPEPAKDQLELRGATRRPATSDELRAEDDGAEEQQNQGYFAQAPAEEPLQDRARLKKAGRSSGLLGDVDLDDEKAADKGKSSSRRAEADRQQKREEAIERAQQEVLSKIDATAATEPATGSAGADSRNRAGSRDTAANQAPGQVSGARGGAASGGVGSGGAASGGAAAGPPALAVPPPAQPAAPQTATQTPPKTAPQAATKAAPARKPSPEPAPPPPADRAPEASAADAAEGEAPAARKEAVAQAKQRERKDDTATRVSALHQQAVAAAARGDCATVRSTSSSIRSLDATYHRDRVARDGRLQECLSEPKKAGKK